MIKAKDLERAIAAAAGVNAAIEVQKDRIVVSGMVLTAGERQAALDVIGDLAPDLPIEDNLEVSAIIPDAVNLDLSQGEAFDLPGTEPGVEDGESDEMVGESEEVYVPPTDPVRSAEGEILGGFQIDSMEEDATSFEATSGGPADEAIAENVRAELRQDSATTDLEIRVRSVGGVVTLRGAVRDLEDAENAVAVAARQAGVVDVVDELEVA